MDVTERRKRIMLALCKRRHDTITNLASEFDVSPRTIRRDIEKLSISEPIYTQTGRYYGGVYVVDGYYLGRLYLQDREIRILEKVYIYVSSCSRGVFSNDDLNEFRMIICEHKKPSKE